jgi:hypothetical protein
MFMRCRAKEYYIPFVIVLGLLLPLTGCQTKTAALDRLKTDELTWTTYMNTELGYTLSHPVIFKPEVYGDGNVLFRYRMGVPVLVRFTDEEDGRRRGAWFGHDPVEKVQLGDRSGQKFIYTHWDGPFGARTVSYVVQYKGKFLALEFRTDGDLYQFQKRILDSFRFTQS